MPDVRGQELTGVTTCEFTVTMDQALWLVSIYKANGGKLSSSLSVALSDHVFPASYGPVFVLEQLEKIQRTDQGEWGVWDFSDGSSWEGPMIYAIQPTGKAATLDQAKEGE